MGTIDTRMLERLPLEAIDKVTFYKRDEAATDLICCNVEVGGEIWIFNEELVGWDLLLGHLGKLPGFRQDWFAAVSDPPGAPCETVAYRKQ